MLWVGRFKRPLAIPPRRQSEQMDSSESLSHCCRSGREVNKVSFSWCLGCKAKDDTGWYLNWTKNEFGSGWEECRGEVEKRLWEMSRGCFLFSTFCNFGDLACKDLVSFQQIVTTFSKTVADWKGFVCALRMRLLLIITKNPKARRPKLNIGRIKWRSILCETWVNSQKITSSNETDSSSEKKAMKDCLNKKQDLWKTQRDIWLTNCSYTCHKCW